MISFNFFSKKKNEKNYHIHKRCVVHNSKSFFITRTTQHQIIQYTYQKCILIYLFEVWPLFFLFTKSNQNKKVKLSKNQTIFKCFRHKWSDCDAGTCPRQSMTVYTVSMLSQRKSSTSFIWRIFLFLFWIKSKFKIQKHILKNLS